MPKSTPAFSAGRFIGARLLPLVLLALVGWWFLRANYGSKQTNQAIASVVRAPITLKDEVQNIPAASWKALALNLPYQGSVDIDVHVVHGNPLNIFLIDSDQMDAIQHGNWTQVRTYTDFNALKSTTYRRTGQLRQGSYYLVVRDTSLGILSQSASDVSVKVVLNP